MDESYSMILHLYQELPYRTEVKNTDNEKMACAQAYDLLLPIIARSEGGTDGCLKCHALVLEEVMQRACIGIAFSEPAETAPPRFVIPQGTHQFLQLPFCPPDGAALEPLLGQFLLSLDPRREQQPFYVRLFKERSSATVVQFFAPIHTTKE